MNIWYFKKYCVYLHMLNLKIPDMKQEEFKDIEGYIGLYQIGNMGTVKRIARIDRFGRKYEEHILKVAYKNRGYQTVCLNKDATSKTHYVHRLVANAFLEKKDGQTQVNHKDKNKANNKVDNLEWITPSENTRHSINNDPKHKKRIYDQLDKINAKNSYKEVIATKGGEVLKFKSTKEAGEYFNLLPRYISRNIKEQREFNGYKFTGSK